MHIMKISASTLLFLTGPAASAALQLPFGLENIKLHLPTFLSSRLPAQETATTSSLLALHKSLIEIPSVTDSERPVADFLAEYLTSHNFTVETQAVDGDRVNVFAYLERGRDTNTLITSHIDTVPPFIPYTINGDRIGGRGSNDAKGSVAAQITAVESLIASGDVSAGDISLLYVVSEETTGSGMKTANDLGIAPKTVIFGEPTENKLAVGHKGILMFDVIAHGKASHSGYPELGVNANSRLIKALAVLDVLELPGSELLGKTTLNVGRIEGGVAYNVVPAEARGKVAVRVAGELEEVRRKIEKEMGQFEVELEFTEVGYGPVKLDYDVEGFETIVCAYGTDVINLKGDHKKYLYGPGSILTAHSDDEFILKSDLVEAVEGYKKLIMHSLKDVKKAKKEVVEEKIEAETPVVVEEVTEVNAEL